MNETERREFAARLRAERLGRFKGSKKAAYTAAGVNSATWERAESGESIKEHTRVAIVSALWPETGGDWTMIPVPESAAARSTSAQRLAQGDVLRRMDELEERLRSREPDLVIETEDGVLVIELKAHPGRGSALEDKLAAALVRALEDPGIDEMDVRLAARRGTSTGRKLRRDQDEASEESQDNGGGDIQ